MKAVIDTNVLLVADLRHGDVAMECVLTCIEHLQNLREQGKVVIDDDYRILREYQRNIDSRRGKNMGAAFLKWLQQNQANQAHVERVHITETAPDSFAEFPDPELQPAFDPPDRKFVAVANAHPDKPPIWQATDCKWLDWWIGLNRRGIQVNFLCPVDIRRFYHAKFPDRGIPTLP